MVMEKKSVLDGKLTDEQLGKLQRKLEEIKRRIDEGTILYQDAINAMQGIIIENKSALYLGVLRGTHEIKAIEHVIDCDAEPFIPDGWGKVEHQKGGIIKFDASKVELYLSKKQKNGSVEGNKLREELKNKKVLNANVLDYLLKNPHLISEEWKKDGKGNTKYIFFWGTIYRDAGGNIYVRCLCWGGGQWQSDFGWLDGGFSASRPSALLAS